MFRRTVALLAIAALALCALSLAAAEELDGIMAQYNCDFGFFLPAGFAYMGANSKGRDVFVSESPAITMTVFKESKTLDPAERLGLSSLIGGTEALENYTNCPLFIHYSERVVSAYFNGRRPYHIEFSKYDKNDPAALETIERMIRSIWVLADDEIVPDFTFAQAGSVDGGSETCPRCNGKGWTDCTWCDGRGYTTRYDAFGTKITDKCTHCSWGHMDCTLCGGDGKL